MNERIEHCLYHAGLTAQGCWDELDDYAKEGIEKFAQLIVAECLGIVHDAERGGSNEIWDNAVKFIRRDLQEHFGVEQ